MVKIWKLRKKMLALNLSACINNLQLTGVRYGNVITFQSISRTGKMPMRSLLVWTIVPPASMNQLLHLSGFASLKGVSRKICQRSRRFSLPKILTKLIMNYFNGYSEFLPKLKIMWRGLDNGPFLRWQYLPRGQNPKHPLTLDPSQSYQRFTDFGRGLGVLKSLITLVS